MHLSPYSALVRPVLFRLDPERVHEFAIASLTLAGPLMARVAGPPDGGGRLTQELMGLRFPNPIGLAAGFDKRARAVPAWPALGFGFAEVGTITAHAQPGNPKPRIHRLPGGPGAHQPPRLQQRRGRRRRRRRSPAGAGGGCSGALRSGSTSASRR